MVNQALFGALLPNTFSKQPAKKTSGARHAFGSNPSGLLNLLNRSQVGLRGPRALGHVFGKRFVVNRYEEYVRCDVLEHNLVFLCLNEWVSSHNVN